jgi:PAS domain S-box-containing protein
MPRKQSLSQSMNRIGKLIHSTLDLREILERVMPEAARAVGSETAAVSLRQGDHWVVRYVHGFPQDMIGAQMDGRREPHVVLAIQTKKPVVINDAFTDARVNCPHMKKWGVHAVLVVPLVMEDEVIGVLSFNRHKPGVPFRKSHADFAGQLASSLSLAVGNAHLFAELQAELAQRGKAERAQQEANEQLQRQSEELRAANEELQAQAEELRAANEELQAQQEELRTQTEELCEGAQALRESEERHRSLFENMLDGYAFCQMLFDRQRRPLDFVYLSVNDAFTRLTGLKDVVGRKVTEVIPTVRTSHPELLETYGRVATTGRPERFEIEFQPLGMWFSISVYCPRPGYFTAVFDNITERKQAEEALRAAHERAAWLARFPEENPNPVLRVSDEGMILYCNPAAAQLPGWACKLGRSPAEPLVRLVRRAMTEGHEVRQDMELGEAFYLVGAVPFPSERYANVYARDITDRKRAEIALQEANEQLQGQAEELRAQAEELQTQAEELRAQAEELTDANAALRQSERRYRSFVEVTSQWAWVTDANGLVVEDIPTVRRFTGQTYEQAKGAGWAAALHDDVQRTLEVWNRAVSTRTPYETEYRMRRHDGTYRLLLARGVPILDDQGNVIEWVGTCIDITERKAAEEALRASERRFRQVAESLPQLVWTCVADGLCDYLSPQWVHYTGKSEAEQLGYRWLEQLHPDDRPRVVDQWQATAAKGENFETEFRIRRHDGAFRWFRTLAVPLRDEAGQVAKWFGSNTDIDDIKRAEQVLRELNATLESRVAERTAELEHRARQLQKLTLELSQVEDRERKRMAEILHDDLQQIIAGAKFQLTVLRGRVKHDASVQALGSHIDEMLREAVEKSRTLSHELSPAVLHYGDLTEALDWLAGQIKAKHGLVVRVCANGPAHVPSEAIGAFVYKAAQELLFNVVKHARVQEAQLRVRRHGPYVCVSVSDRGRGFDPQGLRHTVGFGLLSIRERIELLGGRMKIRSAPGRGSTFFIVVPNRKTPEDSAGAGPRAYPAPEARPDDHGLGGHRGPPLRVLLADDHRIVREGLRSLLGEEGDIEIVGEAVHGREAVDLALRLEPEVVIMDVAMPLIDGDEATRQIKAHRPQTRVIALSTYNETEMLQRMYRAGAEGYVLKTASAEELLAAIRGHNTGGS